MSLKLKALILMAGIALILGGCGKKADFPKAAIEPIKGFSLNAVKPEALGPNPSVQAIYNAELKMISSLDSVAATYDTDTIPPEQWKIDLKGNLTISEPISVPKAEYRFVGPDKEMLKVTGDSPSVRETDGKSILTVYPQQREYERADTTPDIGRNMAAQWLLLTPTRRQGIGSVLLSPIRSMERRPDEKIDGTDVYVIDLNIGAVFSADFGAETRRFYIGKQDLLPRRVLEMRYPSTASAPNQRAELVRMEFTGFECNASIPQDLFTTAIPAGYIDKADVTPGAGGMKGTPPGEMKGMPPGGMKGMPPGAMKGMKGMPPGAMKGMKGMPPGAMKGMPEPLPTRI